MNNKKVLILSWTVCLICWTICLIGHSQAAAQQPDPNDRASSASQAAAAGKEFFTRGYELFEKKAYEKAAPCFYNYLSKNSPDVDEYEWAEFFLGICLKKCGFSHAAVDVLAHLVTRKPNPKIVSYCLELFEEITRSKPFDRDLIINNVICDQDYGFVEKKLDDFINFYQGVFDWEHGFFQWGNDHFKKITPSSYYFYKYLYQKALYSIYQGQVDEATAILRQVLDLPEQSGPEQAHPDRAESDQAHPDQAHPDQADDFKDEAAVTLARLLYEKGRFKEADLLYRRVPVLDQAQILLERAWSQYRTGNFEKAMGLLYAYKAPGFEDYFTPEYYLLKSFIYKGVCHYRSALAVVKEFDDHYSSSLEAIYARKKAVDDPVLLLTLLNKKQINQTWKFLGLLDREKEKTAGFQDQALRAYVEKIYALQIQKSLEDLRKQIKEEYEKMANELLKYQEEANLMEYEIGLDMYQRVSQYHYREEASKDKKAEEKRVVYPFQGEFWNDELDNYKVTLTDKCNCTEEWDIFFK